MVVAFGVSSSYRIGTFFNRKDFFRVNMFDMVVSFFGLREL